MIARTLGLVVLALSVVSTACQSPTARGELPGGISTPLINVDSAPHITVTFEETNIREVIANFADFTGHSFVIGPGVEKSVTAFVRNKPWDAALSAMLEAYGLHAVQTEPGIWRVETLENYFQFEELRLRVTDLEVRASGN
jgi:type II secretory pathway component GspD/PulD (secretin)